MTTTNHTTESTTSDTLPAPSRIRTPRWASLGFVFLGWTVLAAFQSIRLYYLYNFGNPGYMSFPKVIAIAFGDWYLWAALTPAVYYLITRLGLDRRNWPRRLLLHVALALAFSALHVSANAILLDRLRKWFEIPVGTSLPTLADLWSYMLRGDLLNDLGTYLLIAFVSFSLDYYRRLRDEQQRLAEAEARLADTRLAALRSQLQPHFLFNTLNAITALIHTDPHTADRMVARLSELLRMTLELEQVHYIPLEREIAFAERYLEIQRLRFPDRLCVTIDLPDSLRSAQVPPLLLQPLVENSIKHAVSHQSTPVTLSISAAASGQSLRLIIADNGPGLSDNWAQNVLRGHGIRNTRDRLATLYGTRASLTLASGKNGGAAAVIVLPGHAQPRNADA